jgi:hypothetical protein
MNKPPSQSVVDILNRIKALVSSKRVNARSFLQDFDPLRKGCIPKSKFRGGLDNMKLELSGIDIDSLEQYFCVDRELVNYNEFCNIIEQVFTNTTLDKNP